MTTLEFDSIVLAKGSHKDFEAGVCALELAAHLAGEKHSDSPACVSPVLAAFFRNWNDAVDDEFRQKLKPFIPRLLGTAGDGKDERRACIATDWLVRVCAPVWLDLAKLPQHAIALRTADVISNAKAATGIQPFLDAAWKAAVVAAKAAASAAAEDAAVEAAVVAAWEAARAAALEAARNITWNAAWEATSTAARTAAWTAACAAALAAAKAAGSTAAEAATRAAGSTAAEAATRAAALAALQPTVEILQASALQLADRLIEAQL